MTTTTNLHLALPPCRQASNGVIFHSFMNDELICQCGKTDTWGKPQPPPTKTAIVIELDSFDWYTKEYLREMGGDGDNDITERLTLSSFVHWLRRKVKEERDANSIQ